MKYKALILDLDGTAIPHKVDGLPRPRVVQAIKAIQKYIPVCVATSRPLFMARSVIEALGVQGPCALNDSTQLYDPMKKEIVETLYLPQETLPKIVDVFTSFSVPFLVNTGEREFEYKGKKLPKKVCGICVFDVSVKTAEEMITELTMIEGITSIKIPSYKKDLVWVSATPANATKLHSVITVARLLGIETREIVGVGDGYNDFPLLTACGLKIAMRNAVDELKDSADFIAPSVDDDGVAVVIEKILLPMFAI